MQILIIFLVISIAYNTYLKWQNKRLSQKYKSSLEQIATHKQEIKSVLKTKEISINNSKLNDNELNKRLLKQGYVRKD